MTIAEFAENAESWLTIVALIGAIWSAYSFVRSRFIARAARNEAELLRWRKASIQKIMMLSPEWLSTADLTDRLRSSSYDANFDIQKEKLTEQAVRLALMDLVQEGILYQVHGDLYGINQIRLDPSVEVNAELLANHRAAMDAITLISEYPGHYDEGALYKKITEIGHQHTKLPGFRIALYDAANKGLVSPDESGKWIPGRPVPRGSQAT